MTGADLAGRQVMRISHPMPVWPPKGNSAATGCPYSRQSTPSKRHPALMIELKVRR